MPDITLAKRPMIDAVTTPEGDLYLVVDGGGPEIRSVEFLDTAPRLTLSDGKAWDLPTLSPPPRLSGDEPIRLVTIVTMDGYRTRKVDKVPVTSIHQRHHTDNA